MGLFKNPNTRFSRPVSLQTALKIIILDLETKSKSFCNTPIKVLPKILDD